jgi:hypothetical protein
MIDHISKFGLQLFHFELDLVDRRLDEVEGKQFHLLLF